MFVGDIRKLHIWSNLNGDIEASMQRPLLRENISSSDPFVLLLAIGTDATDAKNTTCLSSECPQIAVFGKVLPVIVLSYNQAIYKWSQELKLSVD